MRRFALSHGLFAMAAAGLGILSFTFRDFAPMWGFFPAWIPWRDTWVYGSGLLLLAASAGLCFSRTALPSALTIGAYQAIWAVTAAVAVAFEPRSFGAWYGVFEALTPLLAACIVYDMLRRRSHGSGTPSITGERAVRVAQVMFGLNCVVYGLGHFAYADYTAGMVPAWLPARLGVAYCTGLAHIAAGFAIIVGILPRLAATLEALMMSLFGLLVWVPSLFAQPRPAWATPPRNQWSELVVTLLLAACAWIVATSLRNRPWGVAQRRGVCARVTAG
jgi:uncharacterized membrane protein